MLRSWNDMVVDAGDVGLPTDLEEMFGREAPFALEIGFGSGRFLDWLAGERPAWNLLGVEISAACHSRTYPLLRDAGRENVRIFKGTGEFVVREMLPAESTRRVFVNFPDPWPKKKHHDRRLLTEEFFRTLAGRLEEGGALRLTTDHGAYYDWALDQAEAVDALEVRTGEPPPAFADTKYGRKWRREGREIRHANVRKQGDAPWVPRAIQEVDTMHHATIEGTLPAEVDAETLGTRRLEDGVVAVRDVYERLADDELLVLIHLEESDLAQRILIDVTPRNDPDGRRITVQVRRFNEPLMTEGTSAAVEHVAEWVAGLAPDNEIVERQY